MNADTSWRIWRSDLYSALNTSVYHESPRTAGFSMQIGSLVKHQHIYLAFAVHLHSRSHEEISSVQGPGLWDCADKITQHHFSEVTGKQGQNKEEEKGIHLEGLTEQLEGKREREKHRMKKKSKELFDTILNPQNPKVNKPVRSLWRRELILRHVDYASNSEAHEILHWVKKYQRLRNTSGQIFNPSELKRPRHTRPQHCTTIVLHLSLVLLLELSPLHPPYLAEHKASALTPISGGCLQGS